MRQEDELSLFLCDARANKAHKACEVQPVNCGTNLRRLLSLVPDGSIPMCVFSWHQLLASYERVCICAMWTSLNPPLDDRSRWEGVSLYWEWT